MHSFDGHNDVLLRLWRQGNDGVAAFLEGDGKGQIDLPRAREGGMVGGLYAIFAPSEDKSQANGPIESGTYDILVPPALDLTHVWLHAPGWAERVAHLGTLVRWEGTLELRLRTLAALVVGRHFQAQYVWGIQGVIGAERNIPR